MPVIPAFCPHCDAIFTPRGALAIAALESNLNILGDTTTCAHCAGEAVILDGVFDLVGNSVRRLADARCSRVELDELAAVLAQARSERLRREGIMLHLDSRVPRLRDVLDELLPEQPARLYAVYSLLLYVVFDLLALDYDHHIHVDVNITPYLTVLIDRMVSTKPWSFADRAE